MPKDRERDERQGVEPDEPGQAHAPKETSGAANQSDQPVQPRHTSKRDRDTYMHSRW